MSVSTGDKELSKKLGRRISSAKRLRLSPDLRSGGRLHNYVLARKVFDACHGGFLFFGSSAPTAFAVGAMIVPTGFLGAARYSSRRSNFSCRVGWVPNNGVRNFYLTILPSPSRALFSYRQSGSIPALIGQRDFRTPAVLGWCNRMRSQLMAHCCRSDYTKQQGDAVN